jgi:hypothetical protein
LEEELQPIELGPDSPSGESVDVFILDSPSGPGTTDVDRDLPTIEIGNFDETDDEPAVDTDDVTPLEIRDEPGPKSPTIPDDADMTIMFQAPPGSPTMEEPADKPTRRSTHTLESDKTVDLGMPPDEASLVDLHWRGTFDHGTKQGQTIRQKETISGFRSSLPSSWISSARAAWVWCTRPTSRRSREPWL